MGKFTKGILGGFSGKIGTVIGANWRSIDYMRSLPRKSKKPPTEVQLAQRLIFSMITAFLRPIGDLIRIGYQSSNNGKETPVNAAIRYHIAKAITGVYPNLSINYPEVRFSKGNLLRVSTPEADGLAQAKVKFSWANNAPVKGTSGTDRATLLVYNTTRQEFVVLTDAAARSELTYTLQLPADYAQNAVHCWMSFASVDGKAVSDSYYVGQVQVIL